MIIRNKNTYIWSFLFFVVQTGMMRAELWRSMEQALFAVRLIKTMRTHVLLESSMWEVAKNFKRTFVALVRAAAGLRSLPDPI